MNDNLANQARNRGRKSTSPVVWVLAAIGLVGLCVVAALFGPALWNTYDAQASEQPAANPNPPAPVVVNPTSTPVSSIPTPVIVATVEPLGPDPRHNIQIAAEMIRGGNELLPLRGDPNATIQCTVNDTGMNGMLDISVDPGSTVKLYDAAGNEVAKVSNPQGFAALMPFPLGWAANVETTWNSGNLTWNVWEEFYIPRAGYSAEDFKWVNILYWDNTQGKPHNYFYDGTSFVDLGPNPVRP
jgi:hypothetical protein